MRNGPGGPWAFWIEVKGPKTKVSEAQVRWWYRAIAAGERVYCVRRPADVCELLNDVGINNQIMPDTLLDRAKESEVQGDTKAVLELYGFSISDMSQGYRPGGKRHGSTRQTPGIPDLYVTKPAKSGGNHEAGKANAVMWSDPHAVSVHR